MIVYMIKKNNLFYIPQTQRKRKTPKRNYLLYLYLVSSAQPLPKENGFLFPSSCDD